MLDFCDLLLCLLLGVRVFCSRVCVFVLVFMRIRFFFLILRVFVWDFVRFLGGFVICFCVSLRYVSVLC